jgi:hypothetical protein
MTTTVPTPRPKQQDCDLRGCVEEHTNSLALGYSCQTAAARIELPGGRWIEVRRSQFVVEDFEPAIDTTTDWRVDIEMTDAEPETMSEDAARQLIAVLQFNVDQLAAHRHELYQFNAVRASRA